MQNRNAKQRDTCNTLGCNASMLAPGRWAMRCKAVFMKPTTVSNVFPTMNCTVGTEKHASNSIAA